MEPWKHRRICVISNSWVLSTHEIFNQSKIRMAVSLFITEGGLPIIYLKGSGTTPIQSLPGTVPRLLSRQDLRPRNENILWIDGSNCEAVDLIRLRP